MKRSTYCYWLALAVAFIAGLGGRAFAQGTFDIRAVNMVEGGAPLDFYVNDITPPIITGLEYENASALATKIPVGTGMLNVKVTPAGAGIAGATINQNVTVASAIEYSAIVYKMDGPPKMIVLDRPKTRVPGPGKALLRVLNISTIATPALDIYLDSTGGTPLFSSLAKETVSNFADLTGEPKTLYITAAGTKTVLAQIVAPLTVGGRLTLIITGATNDALKAHALSGENIDAYQLPVLQGLKGGTLPSLRVMHVWRKRNLNGKGFQPLDVFVDDDISARFPTIGYRVASAKYGPLTQDSVTVKFALANEGVGSAIYSERIPLNHDSDYTVFLTKSSEGAAAALTLSAPNTISTSLTDSFLTRVAYLDDFHKNLTIKVAPMGAPRDSFPTLAFLTASDWMTIPRGPFTVEAYRPGDTIPFYTKDHPGDFAATYLTFAVMGDDSSFEIDVLNDLLPVMQIFDASASVATPVAGNAALALRNAPNPCAGATSFRFNLPHADDVNLVIFDQLGRAVATLLDGHREAGEQSVELNTSGLATGTYLYRLRTSEGSQAIGRMMVVR